ncbi:MAG: cation-translocating P-type ATPase [Betaproteobacteria bacterium]|nr:cation-translocating P-type ATPase [Betaproteobacteria bacterium]
MRSLATETFDAYDLPEELARVAAPVPGTAEPRLEACLQVPAIHCAACTTLIEQALAPWTESIRAVAATQQVQIRWDPGKIKFSALLARLADLGYPALPESREAASLIRVREQRRALWRLFVAFFCMMQVMMYSLPRYVAHLGDLAPDQLQLLRWAEWMLTVPVVCFSATPFFSGAWSALRLRRVSMDLTVALGIAIAFGASTVATLSGEGDVWNDSVTMFVTFLLAGRWLDARLRSQAAAGLDRLLTRLPSRVDRVKEGSRAKNCEHLIDADLEPIPSGRLQPGDIVRVSAGQTMPADAIVIAGRSHADESLLTGESDPIPKQPGAAVLAGSQNLDGLIWVRIQCTGAATRFGQIVDLVQRAAVEKPPAAVLADRYAQGFLVAILMAAALAGGIWWWIEPGRAIAVMVAVLIVTCPCAFSLAMPAVTLAATSRLAASGMLLRSPAVIEALAKVDLMAFDKTGTLSDGQMAIEAIELIEARGEFSETDCLAIAAALAQASLHPVARSVVIAAQAQHLPMPSRSAVCEHAGSGLVGRVLFNGHPLDVTLGRESLIPGALNPAPGSPISAHPPSPQTVLTINQRLIARFTFRESLRPDARTTLNRLAAGGIEIAVLSGDRAPAVARLTEGLAISRSLSDATPESKYAWVQAMQSQRRTVAVVGDGINDAPMLALADVSIAVGSAAPIAQLHADIILVSNRLGDLIVLREIAQRAMRAVRQNLLWAGAYNAICVPLALAGAMPPAIAGLGMAGSSLVVILNALRLLRR